MTTSFDAPLSSFALARNAGAYWLLVGPACLPACVLCACLPWPVRACRRRGPASREGAALGLTGRLSAYQLQCGEAACSAFTLGAGRARISPKYVPYFPQARPVYPPSTSRISPKRVRSIPQARPVSPKSPGYIPLIWGIYPPDKGSALRIPHTTRGL